MVATKYIPGQRDIVWVDFDPAKGHEQQKRRPAIVMTPKSYNQRSKLMVVCPITSVVKNYPFEIPFKESEIQGAVLVDHVRSLDWKLRNTDFIEKVSNDVFEAVRDRLEKLLIKQQ